MSCFLTLHSILLQQLKNKSSTLSSTVALVFKQLSKDMDLAGLLEAGAVGGMWQKGCQCSSEMGFSWQTRAAAVCFPQEIFLTGLQGPVHTVHTETSLPPENFLIHPSSSFLSLIQPHLSFLFPCFVIHKEQGN